MAEGGVGLSRLASPVCAWSFTPEVRPSSSTEPPFYPLNLHRNVYSAQWFRADPDKGSAGQFRERLFLKLCSLCPCIHHWNNYSFYSILVYLVYLFWVVFFVCLFWVVFCLLVWVCFCSQPQLNSHCSSCYFQSHSCSSAGIW